MRREVGAENRMDEATRLGQRLKLCHSHFPLPFSSRQPNTITLCPRHTASLCERARGCGRGLYTLLTSRDDVRTVGEGQQREYTRQRGHTSQKKKKGNAQKDTHPPRGTGGAMRPLTSESTNEDNSCSGRKAKTRTEWNRAGDNK